MGGVWFPAYSNITCTGKGVKIDPTNQWIRITIYDNSVGWLEVLTLWTQETKWHWVCVCLCVCVYSNSRNDVPQVAQRYGTIAAHTRRCASVPVVFVVFLRAHVQFCGFDKADAPQTFSDTAVTDRHSDTTIYQLRAHWVWISWSIGSEKLFGHVPPMGVEAPYPLGQALRLKWHWNS